MAESIRIYGIKNCDTMKKALVWLHAHGLSYDFHDYKKAGVDPEKLKQWVNEAGWERILNRAGTTFRKLPDADRENVTREKAIALMVANPSTIKRPIVETRDALEIGFKPEAYAALFGG